VPTQTPTVGTSREIGWTIYGFARLATDLHARRLVADALRAARVVQAHLPHGGVPPAAYGAGAPPDVSAAVVTAAGLLQLRQACALLGGCPGGGGQWGTLAQRVLVAGLDKASAVPPFGLLSGQVLNYRGSGNGCWCNHGELMLGDSYALEALRILKLGPLTPPWEKAR
jgi:hypothetical protein